MLEIKMTTGFKKDLKVVKKRKKNIVKLDLLVKKLVNNAVLEIKYKDHSLLNNNYYINMRECHIEPDWLLVYCIDRENQILLLYRTGSHSDLFK